MPPPITASKPQGVTYMQREAALGIAPLKPTLGIGQVHADRKADHAQYMNDRRALMLKYIPATYKLDKAGKPTSAEAVAIKRQIDALDAKMLTSKTTISEVKCNRREACKTKILRTTEGQKPEVIGYTTDAFTTAGKPPCKF